MNCYINNPDGICCESHNKAKKMQITIKKIRNHIPKISISSSSAT